MREGNKDVFTITTGGLVKEAIEEGTCSFVELSLNEINKTADLKLTLETVGKGKDIMFRLLETSVVNKTSVVTPFINVITLATLIASFSDGLKNDLIIGASVEGLKIAGIEFSIKNLVSFMLKQCSIAYTNSPELIAKDAELFIKNVGIIEANDLKEL